MTLKIGFILLTLVYVVQLPTHDSKSQAQDKKKSSMFVSYFKREKYIYFMQQQYLYILKLYNQSWFRSSSLSLVLSSVESTLEAAAH